MTFYVIIFILKIVKGFHVSFSFFLFKILISGFKTILALLKIEKIQTISHYCFFQMANVAEICVQSGRRETKRTAYPRSVT